MGYAYVPLIASVVLVVHHVAFTDAPRGRKLLLAVIVAASVAIWHYRPQWTLLATLLQVGASIAMLVYLRVHAQDRA